MKLIKTYVNLVRHERGRYGLAWLYLLVAAIFMEMRVNVCYVICSRHHVTRPDVSAK